MNKAEEKTKRLDKKFILFNTVNSAAALSFIVHEPSGIME